MSIPSVIDLCGGGWWSLVPLPSPPHPDCFQVWMFQFAAHRHLLWDLSPGKLFTLPSDTVSQDFSQCCSYFPWTQDIILRKIYCPPAESGVTGVKEMVLWISCCPQLFVRTRKWCMGERSHSGVITRRCAPWVKSHCVLLRISGFVCEPTV